MSACGAGEGACRSARVRAPKFPSEAEELLLAGTGVETLRRDASAGSRSIMLPYCSSVIPPRSNSWSISYSRVSKLWHVRKYDVS